jgi:hypothetical protein
MIYSPLFDALPLEIRRTIYKKIFDQLKDDPAAKILRETKRDV